MFKNIIRKFFSSQSGDFETIVEPRQNKIHKPASTPQAGQDPPSKETTQRTSQDTKLLQISQGIMLLRNANQKECRKAGISPDAFLTNAKKNARYYCDGIKASVLLIEKNCSILYHADACRYFEKKLGSLVYPFDVKFGLISPYTQRGDKFDLYGKLNFSINIISYKEVWYIEDQNGYYTIDLSHDEFIYAEKRYWRVSPVSEKISFTSFHKNYGSFSRFLSLKVKLVYKGNNILVPVNLAYCLGNISKDEIPETVIKTFDGTESHQEIECTANHWFEHLKTKHNVKPMF